MGQDFAEGECRRKYLDEDRVHGGLREGISPTGLAYYNAAKGNVTWFVHFLMKRLLCLLMLARRVFDGPSRHNGRKFKKTLQVPSTLQRWERPSISDLPRSSYDCQLHLLGDHDAEDSARKM
jgi:hypothetical protein